MVTAILLDDHRWAEVPEARRTEWRLAIRELLDEHLFRIDKSPLVMRVSWDDARVKLTWEALSEGVVAEVSLDRQKLDAQMRDYVEVCRKLSALDAQKASIGEITSLDQQKRDSHDLAARDLIHELDVVGPTHDTARMLFTLLVVLLVDTTQLSVLQRPHGAGVIARYTSELPSPGEGARPSATGIEPGGARPVVFLRAPRRRCTPRGRANP